VDAEGSFGVTLVKKDSGKVGYSVLIYFEIALNKKDEQLLEIVKRTLGGGASEKSLYYNKSDDTLKLRISNLDVLINNVIPHFNKYPLFTQKRVDFLLMCKIIELVQEKKHLTTEGINEILSIKAAMNLGLSDKLKNEFLSVKSLTRLSVDTGIPNKE
jgi:hypothetical protein